MLSLTCGCTDVTLSKKRLCFCRPASAEGGAGSSEPAGLYWRKHRLVVPAAYAMTEEAAQSAAPHSPTAAQQDSPDGSKTPTLPAASLEVTCAVLPEAVAESASADALEESDVCSSSSASLPLVIDDAADLTHDSAAAILRQLSYECQAAGLHATVTAHTNSGVSGPNMQLLCGDQEELLTANHEAATAATGPAPTASHAPANASVSMTWPTEHDSTPEQVRHCPQPDEVEEGVASVTLAVSASVHQHANGTAVDQGVDATSEWHADKRLGDVTCCQPGLASNLQLSENSAQQAAPGQRAAVHEAAVAESPFLQRLRMSKQAGSSAPAAAAVQPPLSMQGQLEIVCIHAVLPTTTKQSA